jgi:hypothetical protein
MLGAPRALSRIQPSFRIDLDLKPNEEGSPSLGGQLTRIVSRVKSMRADLVRQGLAGRQTDPLLSRSRVPWVRRPWPKYS